MPWDRRTGSWPQDEPSEGDAILGASRRAPALAPAHLDDKGGKGGKGSEGAKGSSKRNQLLLAMVASLGYLMVGLVRGFSSPGVPSMRQRDPHLLEAPGAVSWISSIPPLGACVGSLVAGPLLQRAGRRRTLLLSAPLALGAWVALALAQSYGALLTARILTGFCAGLVIPSAQVYVSECARPSARGVLGSLPALFMSAGILLGYVVGALVPWRWLAGASALCPAALLALLLPLPESPAWLSARGRTRDAEAALSWLKRPPLAPAPHALPLAPLAGAEKAGAEAAGAGTGAGAGGGPLQGLLRRSVLVPFGLSLALMVFQQLSGIDAVVFYTVEIFEAAGGGVPEHVAAAAVGAVQLAANGVALLAVDRAGRRPLLLASSAVSAAAMAALGAYFYLLDHGRAEGLGALPLASLIVFMVGFSVGLCTLPYLMMSEMLPAAQRGVLSSAAGSFNLAVMFLVIKTFHDLSGALGEAGAFWVYASLCVASCVFVLVCVPETKGRSLEEIQAHFERRDADAGADQRAEAAALEKQPALEKQSALEKGLALEKAPAASSALHTKSAAGGEMAPPPAPDQYERTAAEDGNETAPAREDEAAKSEDEKPVGTQQKDSEENHVDSKQRTET